MFMGDTCIELTVRSMYRLTTTVYLPHNLMRHFFGDNDYYALLQDLKTPAHFELCVNKADAIKSYESDTVISSLQLLECLVVAGVCDEAAKRIRDFIRSDSILGKYPINYDLNTLQDIEFAISCKVDYTARLSFKISSRAKNIISRYYFKQYVSNSQKMAVN